ncbi:MAG: hypothetical protein ACRBN8_39965 [Nannocystales bacterium]
MRPPHLSLSPAITAFVSAMACSSPSPEDPLVTTQQPTASPNAIEHNRVPQDAQRDALRHPEVFMDFAGVAPGHQVLELGGGDGYTSMHIARRAGPSGGVLAVNPPQWSTFMRPYIAARLANGPVAGLTFAERPFDDPVPPGHVPLDLVVCVLIYHDILYIDVDRARMNERLFAALEPGGKLLIIDHAAGDPNDLSVGGTLHRIGKDAVIDEVTAAGFSLVNESDALSMPEDPHTGLAWTDPQPRTDRFVLLFEKPKR